MNSARILQLVLCALSRSTKNRRAPVAYPTFAGIVQCAWRAGFPRPLLSSPPKKTKEISIFNPNFGGLTRSNTKFWSLSKFDIVRAKCFETGVFHLFSIFPLSPLIFAFPSQGKKTYLPFALSTWIDQEGSKPSFSSVCSPLYFRLEMSLQPRSSGLMLFPPKKFWQHMAIIFWFRDDKLHAIYNIQITHKHCNICSIR